jgi:hypothetical protein
VKVEAVPVGWTDEMDDRLRVSAGDDLEIIRREVRTGIAQLWQCEKDGRPEAWVVTRVDGTEQDGYEWVIVLGEGRGFFDYMPLFVSHARDKGLPIRTHVKRRGLIRMWERLGLHLDHYVLRG